MTDVATYLATCTHPKRDVLLTLRDIILAATPELDEHIKWNAPSYQVAGDDRITFNLARTDAVLIVFHRGAKAKDTKTGHRLVADSTGWLKWATDQRATASFASLHDVTARHEWLAGFVAAWNSAVQGE